MIKVAVLGYGSWGTALAIHLSKIGHKVNVWGHNKDKIRLYNETKQNFEYLPEIIIPDNVLFTENLEEAISDSDFIVMAVPTHIVREVSQKISGFISNQIIVNVAKGIENDTLLTMSGVIKEILPNIQVVALYGPTHAEEVAKEIPSAIVAACTDEDVAKKVQDLFMSENFRVYTNTDIIGVEIGGSIKNVIALCAGISDGLGFGDNTKAALMTRGLSEISRLGSSMGANPLTFAGLTGVGDLIVTCTSMHSRNRRFGILIGKGKSIDESQKEVHMVVEGIKTTMSAYNLAKKHNISMPITEQAYEVLFNNKNAKLAVSQLMIRDKKGEVSL